MKILLSPTKKQEFYKGNKTELTQPYFISEVNRVIGILKDLSLDELKKLFKVSDNIAKVNSNRYNIWFDTPKEGSPTLFTYTGEAFKSLSPNTLKNDDINFINDNLLIFSGLYGILKPTDKIKLYRLDIADKLKIDDKTLYNFWRDKINSYLSQIIKNDEVILNLASKEYTKNVDFKSFSSNVITPEFKTRVDGNLKTIAIWSKKMRGLMAREVSLNRAETVKDIQEIKLPGYKLENISSNGIYLYIKENS